MLLSVRTGPVGREFIVRYASDSSRKSLFSLPSFFRSSRAKTSSNLSQEASDSDHHSENDSVNSFSGDSKEGKTREIVLQADDAQVTAFKVFFRRSNVYSSSDSIDVGDSDE